jgi:signal transduction histidine kinase
MPVDFKYRFFYLIIGFTFYTLTGSAQADKDSLLKVVQNSQDINAKLSAQNRLTYYMMWTDIDSAHKMLDELAPHVKKVGNLENQARFISLKGTFHWFNGNYDSALYYYRQCMVFSKTHNLKGQYNTTISNLGALFNQLSITDSSLYYLSIALESAREEKDSATIAKIHFDLGITYNKINYNNLALENLLKAKEFFSKIHDTVTLSLIHNSLGNTYKSIGNFEKSRDASFAALQYDLASKRIDQQSNILNNIGVNYWKNKHHMDSAKYYIKKAIEMPSTSEQPIKLMTYFTNLGGIEFECENFRQALFYLQKARSIETPFEDYFTKSGLFVNLGAVWLSLGNIDSAYFYSQQGLEMALKIDAFEHVKNAYRNLFETDSVSKNYLSAIKYYQLFKNYTDTISNVEVRNRIAELDIIYMTAQKDKENAFLLTQNQLNQEVISKQSVIVFISLAALITFFVFLILLLRNQRKLNFALDELHKKNTEIEKKQAEIEMKNQHLQLQKEKLTELNQTKDKFFSIIAHDLKSPFNALLGFLDVLENDFDTMSDAEKFDIIKILHENSENTYNLLVNLLDWSRSQRGLIKNHPAILRPREVAESAMDILSQRASRKEHSIQNLISSEQLVYADPNLTQTVFINLINNAIKFTPRKGTIILNSVEKNGLIGISVTDNGIGIPKAKIDGLFDINSDFNRKGTENEIGTGLGLKMFKEFVETMGGTISAESEENKGTTFTFSLPVYHSGRMRQS